MAKRKGTESIAGKKTTSVNSKWFMNTAKSIGFSAADIISEITPGISGFASENLQYAQDLRDTLKQAKENSRSLADQFNVATQVGIAKEAIKNAREDMKTGNFYNKQRIEASFDDGFDFDDEFDDANFNESSTEEQKSTKGVSREAKNLEARVQSNKMLADVTRASSKGIMDSIARASNNSTNIADAMMNNNQKIAQTSLLIGQKMHDETINGLESINKNIGLLVNFNNDSMAKYVAASITFYDQSIQLQNKLAPKEEEKKVQRERDFDQAFSGYGGSFSARGYTQVVKKNIRTFKEENILLSAIDNMFQDTDTLKHLAQSPLSFLSKKLATKLIPEFTKATLKQMDQSFSEFFPALISKITGGKNSNNAFIRSLSQIFGLDDSINTNVSMGFGEKAGDPGKITNRFVRTVEEVIPTYLRQMTSALTGLEEQGYSMEDGRWKDISEMQRQLDTRLDQARVSGYTEIRDYFKAMGEKVDFGTEKSNTKFMEGIDTFLKNLSGQDGLVNITKSKEVEKIHRFDSKDQQDTFKAMIDSLTNAQRMGLAGRNTYESRKELARLYREIEERGTLEGRTLLSGARLNAGFTKGDDGRLSLKKGSGPQSVDAFNMSSLDYLRNILKVLSDGVRTYPVTNGRGAYGQSGGGYKKTVGHDVLAKLKESEEQKSARETEELIRQNRVTDDKSTDPNRSKVYIGRENTSNAQLQNVFRDAVDEYNGNKAREAQEKRKKSMLDYAMNAVDGDRKKAVNSVREFVDKVVGTPARMMDGVFKRIDGVMHDVIFGKDEEGTSFVSTLQMSFDKNFFRMTEFMKEKLINPIVDKVAGKDGIFEKIKGSDLYKKIAGQMSAIFIGGKAADGTEMEGIFTQRIKKTSGWISDSSKKMVNMITGEGYTKSDGTKVERNENNVMNKTSSFIKGIFSETKNYMFGDKSSSDPDKRRGSLTFITDTLGQGMIAWRDAMFGPSGKENETGRTVLKDLGSTLKKGLPRAFGGYVAGAAIGGAVVSSLGLIGSTFLPGAPMGMAILGGALGFASRSENFMDWAFGERGGDGKRIGGMILKRSQMAFWKNNKNKIIGGAASGVASSALLGGVISSLPVVGVLGGMLMPGGPIGAAMMGIASAFVLRSETFQSMMFGPKNADGKRVGGMIGRMFRGPSNAIGKKAAGNAKLGAAIVGGAGGLLAGKMLAGAGIFGLAVSPVGPIGMALMGTAAGIALTSEKFNTFMFGKWNEEDGMREGGIFTKMGNWMRLEIMAPFRNALGGATDYMKYWFKHSVAAPIGFMTEPLIKLAKDTIVSTMNVIKGTVKATWKAATFLPKMLGKTINSGWKLMAGAISDSFEKRVGIPLSEAFTRFIFRPFAKLGKGILKTFSIAGKAATSAVMAPGMIAASGKMGYDSAKSMARYVAANVRTGNLSAAFDPKLMTQAVYGQEGEGNYVAERYLEFRKQRKAAKDEYKQSRAERKQMHKEMREEQNAYMRNGYNKYGKIDYRKMVLGKLDTDRIKNLGVSAGEMLGISDATDLNTISQRQMKELNRMLWASLKSGKTGDDLRSHLKLVPRAEDTAENKAVVGINESNKTLEDIKHILKDDKGFDVNNSRHMSIVGRMMQESMAKAMSGMSLDSMVGDSESKKSLKLGRRSLGAKFRNETANLFPNKDPEDYGSASTSPMSRMVRLGNRTGQQKSLDLNVVGCGPKAVSMALSHFGKSVTPEQVIAKVSPDDASEVRGLSLSAVTKVLKEYGLRVSTKSLTKNSIVQAFNSGINVQLVYMKKYGGGHFIIISNFDETSETVTVSDPDNKISGRRPIDWIINASGGGTTLTLSDGSIIKRTTSKGLGKTMELAKKPVKALTNSVKSSAMNTLNKVPGMGMLMSKASPENTNLIAAIHAIFFGKGSSIPVSIMDGGQDKEGSEASGGGSADAFKGGGTGNRGTVIGIMKYIADTVKFIGKAVAKGVRMLVGGITRIGRGIGRGIGKAFGAVKNLFTKSDTTQQQVTTTQAPGRRRGIRGMARSFGSRIGSVFSDSPAVTASKVGGALVRAGNIASGAMSRIPGVLNTSTGAIDGYNFGKKVTENLDDKHAYNSRLTASKYLSDKAAEAKAAEESSFRANSVDLLTRIEINTRTISEVLGDMFDMQKGFYDWLKRFLQNKLPEMFKDLAKSIKDAINDASGNRDGGGFGSGGDSSANAGRKVVKGIWWIRRRLKLMHKLMDKMFLEQIQQTGILKNTRKDIGMIGKKLVKMHLQQIETHATTKVISTNTANTNRRLMKTNEHLIEIMALIRMCCKMKPLTRGMKQQKQPRQRPIGLPAPNNGQRRLGLPGPNRPIGLPGPNPNQPRLGHTPRNETPTGRPGQTVVSYGPNGQPVSNQGRHRGAVDGQFTEVQGSGPIGQHGPSGGTVILGGSGQPQTVQRQTRGGRTISSRGGQFYRGNTPGGQVQQSRQRQRQQPEIIDADFTEIPQGGNNRNQGGNQQGGRNQQGGGRGGRRRGPIFNQNMGITNRMFSQETYDAVGRAGQRTRGAVKSGAKGAAKAGKGLWGGIKAIGKGIAKTGAKAGAAVGTGGVAMAGFGAMDAAYGYANADYILGKEGKETSTAEKSAVATASVITGAIPVIDTIDEILGNKGKKAIAETILAAGPVIDKVKDVWNTMVDSVTETVTGLKDSAVEKFTELKDKTVEKFVSMKDWVVEKASDMWTGATEAFGAAKDWVVDKFVGLKDWVKDKATDLYNGASEAFGTAKDWVVDKFVSLKDWVVDKAKLLWEKGTKAFTDLKDEGIKHFTSLKDKVVGKAKELWKKGTEIFTKLKDETSKKFGELKDKTVGKAKELFTEGVKKFTELKDKVVGKFTELVKEGPGKLKKMVTDSVKKLGEFSTKVIGYVADLPSAAVDGLKNLGSSVTKALGGFVDKVVEFASNLNPFSKGKGYGMGTGTYGSGTGQYAPKGNRFMLPAKQRNSLLKGVYNEIDESYGGGNVDGGCPDCHGPNCMCNVSTGKGPDTLNGDTYYSQKDSRWANKTVDGKLKMGAGGCGPTAASMVVSSLNSDKGGQVTPDDANKFAIANGMTDEKLGTNSNLFSSFGAANGVSVMEDRANADSVTSQLRAGNKVILRGQGGRNFTNGGHFVVATGMSGDGKIKINDPLSKGRSGSYSVDQVMKNTTNSYVAGKSAENVIAGMGGAFGAGDKGSPYLTSTFGTGVSGVDFVKEGMKHLKKPYIWGGRNLAKGADCSGFTQEVTKKVMGKVVISGNAHTQMGSGNLIDVKFSDACVGDIIWFYGTYGNYGKNRATHIAFLSGDNEMLGAAGDNRTGSIRFDVISKEYWYPRIIKVRRVKGTTPGPRVKLDGKIAYKKSYYTPNNPKLTGGSPDASTVNKNGASTPATPASAGADLMAEYTKRIAGLSSMDKIAEYPKMFENIMMNEVFGTKTDFRKGTAFELPVIAAATTAATAAANSGNKKSGIDVNSSGSFNPTGDKNKFITTVKPGAVTGQTNHKVLASLTLAQGALESGWGKKSIGNNLFGIKAGKNWTGKTKTVRTREVDKFGRSYYVNAAFRDYDTIDDSIIDHAKLLTTPRYAKVLKARNYKEATKAVKEAGYATDPKYPQLLNSIIEKNKLNQWDKPSSGGGNVVGSKPMNRDQMKAYSREGSYIDELRSSTNTMSSRGFGPARSVNESYSSNFELRPQKQVTLKPSGKLVPNQGARGLGDLVFGSGDVITNKMQFEESVASKTERDIKRNSEKMQKYGQRFAAGILDAGDTNILNNTTIASTSGDALKDIVGFLSAIADNTDAIKKAPGVVNSPQSVQYNDNKVTAVTGPSGSGDNMQVTQLPANEEGNSLDNNNTQEALIRATLVAMGRQ